MTTRKRFFRFADSPSPSDKEEDSPLTRSVIRAEPTETEGPVPFQTFNIETSWYKPEPKTQSTAPTSSRESYQTAPELSEPVEKLFRDILQKNEQSRNKTSESLKINTMEIDTKPKTPENPEPAQNIPLERLPIQQPNINPIVFPELPPALRPTELKLATPEPFTGNREELNGFLLDLNLYLTVNHEIYDTSFKKIGYALSFMTSGDAKSWKDQYLEESNRGEYLNLGTWLEFTEALQESFEPYNAPGDTMEKIINLKKGDATVETHCEIQNTDEKGQDSQGFSTSNRLLHEVVADPLAKGSYPTTHPA